MGKSAHRYIVNAVGKGGQIYLTQCKDKFELNQWLEARKNELVMEELQITDKNKHPLLKLFSLKKF
jgi:hypothetical protein